MSHTHEILNEAAEPPRLFTSRRSTRRPPSMLDRPIQPGHPMRKLFANFAASAVVLVYVLGATQLSAAADDWESVLARARGQSVYWHAWAGDDHVTKYIGWTAAQVKARFGVTLHHVKIANTSDTVSLLIAEKAAGRTQGGRVDLIWLNGENFAALKTRDLLHGPFTPALPNFRLVDTANKITTVVDATLPTEGFESPWGMAQIVFFADPAVVPVSPRSMLALAEWAKQRPGRFTYPSPPDFTGTAFLKQVLLELTPDRSALYQPVTDAAFQSFTGPLWNFIDGLHPSLWRKGAIFPANYPALRQLMNDGELDIAFAYNPAEANSAAAQHLLPATVRVFVPEGGSIGNTHYVAIPRNAAAKEGAMVVANFLLSPEAQARKADPSLWGDPTVLDVDALDSDGRKYFSGLPVTPAMPAPHELRQVLAEPHPSWTVRIAQEWQRRYSR